MLERLLFASRWMLVPIYVGLALSLALLLAKFAIAAVALVAHGLGGDMDHLILGVLGLVDLSLVANLVLMVTMAGYQNFVGRFRLDDHPDWPGWMGHISYGDLKIKLVASAIVISAIHLLEDFVNTDTLSNRDLGWRVGIHLTLVGTGVLLAVMDRIGAGGGDQP